MSIAFVSVVSSAVVAVAGILATVLTRRTDRKHERAMIRANQMSVWEVEWWRRREETYLDLLRAAERAQHHFEYLNSITGNPKALVLSLFKRSPKSNDIRDLGARLDAYGSTEVNERYRALLDAQLDDWNPDEGRSLQDAMPLLRDRHYDLALAIRKELAAGPTARSEEPGRAGPL